LEEEEYTALIKNETFSASMKLPPGQKAITTKMVLRIKEAESPGGVRRKKGKRFSTNP
jgi:hypothetical protein